MPSANEEKSKSEHLELNENARRSNMNHLKVLAGLKKGERYKQRPDDFEGVILVQGSFLRYRKKKYSLSSGFLSIYATTNNDNRKFEIDLAFSCVSFNPYKKWISINTEQDVHYIKLHDYSEFDEFLQRLRAHRLYRTDFVLYSLCNPKVDADKEKVEQKSEVSKVVGKAKKSVSTHQQATLAATDVSSFDQLKNLHMRAEALALDLRVAYEKIAKMPNSSEFPEVETIKNHWQIVSLVQSKLDAILKPHRQSSMYHAESLNRLAELRVQLHESKQGQKTTTISDEKKSKKKDDEDESDDDDSKD